MLTQGQGQKHRSLGLAFKFVSAQYILGLCGSPTLPHSHFVWWAYQLHVLQTVFLFKTFGVSSNKIWPGELDIHPLLDTLILFHLAMGLGLAFHTHP